MENKKTGKKEASKKQLKFENCETVGDNIEALTRYFTGTTLGEYTLEHALECIRANNKKLEDYKEKLIAEGV